MKFSHTNEEINLHQFPFNLNFLNYFCKKFLDLIPTQNFGLATHSLMFRIFYLTLDF